MSDREPYTRKGDLVASPQTLAGFLLARIAEDVGSEWHDVTCSMLEEGSYAECDCGVPARVLAECEAKRRIVEEHDCIFWPPGDPGPALCGECGGQYFPCPTLRALALPYADHPDYREEWKP